MRYRNVSLINQEPPYELVQLKNNLRITRLCAPLPFHLLPSSISELWWSIQTAARTVSAEQKRTWILPEFPSKSEVSLTNHRHKGQIKGVSQLFPDESLAGHRTPRHPSVQVNRFVEPLSKDSHLQGSHWKASNIIQWFKEQSEPGLLSFMKMNDLRDIN